MPITLNGTTGEVFPSWTTATRPASPAAGQTGFNTTTGQMETYDGTSWEIYAAASSQGASGEVLRSNGSGAAPSWGSASGALIRAPQILTSGTSYTTPSNCTAIYVEAVGGGAGGRTTSGAGQGGGGGGSGGYSAKYFTVTGSTAYTYAIGAAGIASGSGGNTTFTVSAVTITGNGGAASGDYFGGIGGTGTGGDFNIGGSAGGSGSNSGGTGVGGTGGCSLFGGGGRGGINGVGSAPVGGYGGGGGGASGSASGGAGRAGVIRIWEFT